MRKEHILLLILTLVFGSTIALAQGTGSLDGTLVFMSTRDTGSWQVYKATPLGWNILRLTDTSGPDAHPRISPDGNEVVFETTRDGRRSIYIVNIDGTDLRAVTTPDTEDRHPAWSPDGQYIAFHSRHGAIRTGRFTL